MLGARLWSGLKFATYAIAGGFALGLAMVFIHRDWAGGAFCLAPVCLGIVGFVVGLVVGGKTSEQLRMGAFRAVQRECRASHLRLHVIDHTSRSVGPKVTTGEHVSQALQAHLWRGTARIDCLQAMRIGSREGEFHLVIPWSGRMMLAHEFFSWGRGHLPAPIALARGVLGSWSSGDWIGLTSERDDPVANAARDAGGTLIDGIEWNWQKGRLKIELKWGLQAVPMEKNRYLHVMHTAQLGIFRKSFGLDWYLGRRRAFLQFVSTLKPDGKQESEFPFPASSLMILHELALENAPDVMPAGDGLDAMPADE